MSAAREMPRARITLLLSQAIFPDSPLHLHWGFGARNSTYGNKVKISRQNWLLAKGLARRSPKTNNHPPTRQDCDLLWLQLWLSIPVSDA